MDSHRAPGRAALGDAGPAGRRAAPGHRTVVTRPAPARTAGTGPLAGAGDTGPAGAHPYASRPCPRHRSGRPPGGPRRADERTSGPGPRGTAPLAGDRAAGGGGPGRSHRVVVDTSQVLRRGARGRTERALAAV